MVWNCPPGKGVGTTHREAVVNPMTDHTTTIDLPAYLARVGYSGDLSPTLETLRGLHLAHASRIPFENLNVLMGLEIRLDPESLQAKLVRDRRGGYCFEQNGLFAYVLEQVGFTVTRLSGRVRFMNDRVLPRTHMALKVDVEGASWLADVGFGGWGMLLPIPLEAGPVVSQFAWSYRLAREGDAWVLQSPLEDGWRDLYAFTLEPHLPVDYEPGNYFVSTHPQSIFVRSLLAQRPSPTTRYILKNREFVVAGEREWTRRTLASDDELRQVLDEHFGLTLPPGVSMLERLEEG